MAGLATMISLPLPSKPVRVEPWRFFKGAGGAPWVREMGERIAGKISTVHGVIKPATTADLHIPGKQDAVVLDVELQAEPAPEIRTVG